MDRFLHTPSSYLKSGVAWLRCTHRFISIYGWLIHHGIQMTSLEPGLYVRIEELADGPAPLPLSIGFSLHQAYRALGLYRPPGASDAFLVLSNDRDEICLVCNSHVRAYALLPCESALVLPIRWTARKQMALA